MKDSLFPFEILLCFFKGYGAIIIVGFLQHLAGFDGTYPEWDNQKSYTLSGDGLEVPYSISCRFTISYGYILSQTSISN